MTRKKGEGRKSSGHMKRNAMWRGTNIFLFFFIRILLI